MNTARGPREAPRLPCGRPPHATVSPQVAPRQRSATELEVLDGHALAAIVLAPRREEAAAREDAVLVEVERERVAREVLRREVRLALAVELLELLRRRAGLVRTDLARTF